MSYATIEAYIIAETDRAVLVNEDPAAEDGVWIPKSQIMGDVEIDQLCEFDIPEWLALREGLI